MNVSNSGKDATLGMLCTKVIPPPQSSHGGEAIFSLFGMVADSSGQNHQTKSQLRANTMIIAATNSITCPATLWKKPLPLTSLFCIVMTTSLMETNRGRAIRS
jgi:hypothetical protein